MTRLLIIRHGQSMANVEEVFAGHFDSPPSELGLLQAKKTAEYVCSTYKIDKVYTSDLKRAYAVGRAVCDIIGGDPIPDENLREISAGLWEGKRFEELFESFEMYRETWLHDIGKVTCDGGESVAHLQERFVSALKRISEENDGKTVVIATHATPIRSLRCYCAEKPIEEMKNIRWVTNASVSVFECENGKFAEILAGYDEHLGELVTRFPAKV
ncbi:MAG: histidine phosphatase family protein [Ruminococcaceae bacterium]|nr:histidine phosphatase family protein [Oscillospiraceae bacterium]